jgi:hypothetical protein
MGFLRVAFSGVLEDMVVRGVEIHGIWQDQRWDSKLKITASHIVTHHTRWRVVVHINWLAQFFHLVHSRVTNISFHSSQSNFGRPNVSFLHAL